jgi:hypothetical protein
VHDKGSPVVGGTGVSVGVTVGTPGEVVHPERMTKPPIRQIMRIREECFMNERGV